MKKPSTKKPSNSLPPLTYGTPDVRIPLRRRFWRTVFHGKGLAILLSVGIPLLAIAGYIGYNQYTYQAEKTAYAQLDTDMTTLRDKLQAASPKGVTWEKKAFCQYGSRYMMETPYWRCEVTLAFSSEVDTEVLSKFNAIIEAATFLVGDGADTSSLPSTPALSQGYYTRTGKIRCHTSLTKRDTLTYTTLSCSSQTRDGWYPLVSGTP